MRNEVDDRNSKEANIVVRKYKGKKRGKRGSQQAIRRIRGISGVPFKMVSRRSKE